MTGGRLALCLAAAAVGAGCSTDEAPPVATSCIGEPATIVRALDRAPGPVTLDGDVALSACLRDARTDADLQNVGVAFSRAAEDLELLAIDGDARAALELGYLVGAARRGAATSSGVGAELVRRLERSAALDDRAPPAVVAAIQRGLAAGEARG
jgi:hypothetical protein